MAENRINLDNHLLLCVEDNDLSTKQDILDEYVYLKSNFCGRVVCLRKEDSATWDFTVSKPHGIIYMCGDLKLLYGKTKAITKNVKVIKEFSCDAEDTLGLEYVTLGEVSLIAPKN
jgi:hypothetical protein